MADTTESKEAPKKEEPKKEEAKKDSPKKAARNGVARRQGVTAEQITQMGLDPGPYGALQD